MTRTEQLKLVETTLGPSFHVHFLIGDRVSIPVLGGATGEVTGVATHNLVCTYIVTLDSPLMMRGYQKPASTVVIPGGEMDLLK